MVPGMDTELQPPSGEVNEQAGSASRVEAPLRDPAEIEAYHRAKRTVHIGGIVFSLAYWGAVAFAATDMLEGLRASVSNPWLGLVCGVMIFLVLKTVIELPLDYYAGYVLEKRFDLTNQTPGQWFVFQLKGWLVGGVIGLIVLCGLFGLLWHGGALWGVWAWLGLMVLSVGLAKIFPLLILPIFYPAKALDRPALIGRLERLAEGTGLKITGVYDLELSKDTKKANAMLAGMGATRRVYLSDTLLQAFNDDQIAVVFAHELGHHIRKHIYKGIALSAVVSSIMMALVHWRLTPFAGDPSQWASAVAAFPSVVLAVTVYSLLVSPITNAISRRFEYQCDSDALRLTNDPTAYRQAFDLLGRLNLGDPNPPRWEEVLFDDHPALAKRIAMADKYEAGALA